MNEIFEFLAKMVVNHLVIGCLIVFLIALILRPFSLNAATRHNIWLSLLVMLLIMPLLSLYPGQPSGMIQDQNASYSNYAFPSELIYPSVDSEIELSSASARAVGPSIVGSVTSNSESLSLPATSTIGKDISNSIVNSLNLSLLGISLALVLAAGIVLRTILFASSYFKLHELYKSSKPVDDDLLLRVKYLAKQVGVSTPPRVRHSPAINTPLTSGIRNPWIILPSKLLSHGSSSQLLEQVLLHELAHIKRRDPSIANLQALVSIFLFWHPALHFLNRQIRAERELACDDQVINYNSQGGSAYVKAYANNLVNIAESLQGKVSIAHSVACVHTSLGLMSRIQILLNKKIDHSTSPRRAPGMMASSLALTILIASLPFWPQLPTVYAKEENLAQQNITPAEQAPIHDQIVEETAVSSAVAEIATPSGPVVEIVVERVAETPADKTIELLTEAKATPPSIQETHSEDLNQAERERTAADTATLPPIIEQEAAFDSVDNNLLAQLDSQQLTTSTVFEEQIEEQAETRATDQNFFSLLANQYQIVETRKEAATAFEELPILGEETPRSVLYKIEHSELALYELFNQLNSSDAFDVACERRSVEESRLPQQICEPAFLDSYRQQNQQEVANWTTDNSPFGILRGVFLAPRELSDEELRARASSSMRQMQKELESLANTDPNIRSSLLVLDELQQSYVALVEEQIADSQSLNSDFLRDHIDTNDFSKPKNQVFPSAGRTHNLSTIRAAVAASRAQ